MFQLLIKKCAMLTLVCVFVHTCMIQIILADELPKGIGPIKEIKMEALSLELATAGKKVFESKCNACHKIAERYAGPALAGVSKRRAPEWIMNMILNPGEMVEKDPIAQELLGEYLVKMTFMDVSQDQARSILEYFRYYDEKGDIQTAPQPAQKKDDKKPVTKKKK